MEVIMIVLITGATRGIGAAIADEFAQNGASLILTGTNPKQIDLLNENSDSNRRYISVDFSNSKSLDNFLKEINSLEQLDVCVNNAGVNIIKPLNEVKQKDFDFLTSVNCRAPYLISQAVAGIMKKKQFGHIVNIASIWSIITKAERTLYCASKAGLVGMTRSFATDLAKDNILVNCISPGFTLTDLTRESLSKEEMHSLDKKIPLGRFAEPCEIAKLVYFLCGPLNTYITGQNILIDGGFSNV